MSFRHHCHTALSMVLSAGLICWPCMGRAATPLDDCHISLEELGLEELGLDKDIKKLLKPVKELNVNSGIQNMARTAVQFLNGLNKLTGQRLTVDTGMAQTATVIHRNGLTVDQNKIAGMQKFLKQTQKSLSIDDNLHSLAKEFGNIDHMSESEILGYVWIFCGCLLCIIPGVITQGLGTGCIAMGLNEVVQGGYEEAKRRR